MEYFNIKMNKMNYIAAKIMIPDYSKDVIIMHTSPCGEKVAIIRINEKEFDSYIIETIKKESVPVVFTKRVEKLASYFIKNVD